jgi:hypothetical protein
MTEDDMLIDKMSLKEITVGEILIDKMSVE